MEDIGNDNPRLPEETPEDFAALMAQVRFGSPEAAEQLWRKYGPYIVHAVRRSLHRRLRSRFDSQDFVQAAWASFFTDLPDASRLNSPAALVQFLTTVARHKVVAETRRQRGPRRSIQRQRSLRRPRTNQRYADRKSPTPSQQVSEEDFVEHIVADQPERYGRVVQMRLNGMDENEIAEQEKTTARTVRRVMADLRRLFTKHGRRNRE